jgi:4-amino-4-deoxy-L-arabinose transferase-like glycosyltransferase
VRPVVQVLSVVAPVAARPAEPDGNTPQPTKRRRLIPLGALSVLVLGSAALHGYRLDHPYLAAWDESVHAVVAEHVAEHPLRPTLYEYQALPASDPGQWDRLHIWLHIMPGGMWASGLAMRILGDTPLAARLPGVLFILAGMVATFFLGRRLFDELAGLVGAFVLGFGPLALAVAQGSAFGDLTDTPLIGLSPVLVLAAVKGWQTGRSRWLVVAGLLQWALFLAKGALGLAPLAVVVALYLADLVCRPEPGWRRPGVRGLLIFLGTAGLPIAATEWYFVHSFPQTMRAESQSWQLGFFGNLEHWGAPMDYPVTLYVYLSYGTALALVLAAGVLTAGYLGLIRRQRADLVVFVWFIAVYAPICVAVSKATPMSLPALGASGLLIGRLVSLTRRASRPRWQIAGLSVLASAAVMSVVLIAGATFNRNYLKNDLSPKMINPSGAFYLIKQPGRANPYLLLAVGAVGFAVLIAVGRWLARRRGWRIPGVPLAFAVLLAVPAAYVLRMDVAFLARPQLDPGPGPAIGPYLARHTPDHATIFLDLPKPTRYMAGHDRLAMMFWAHRDTYTIVSIEPGAVCPLVGAALAVSSPPVLVTTRRYAGPATPIGTTHGWYVQRILPCSGAG